MDQLTALLIAYQRRLFEESSGFVPAPDEVPPPDVVLLALEEMLGVEFGGQALGEALVDWLSLPESERKPVQFADLQSKWDAMCQDIQADADLAEHALLLTEARLRGPRTTNN